MAIILLLVFILVPVIEIGVFIELGGRIGAWPTIGLILLTAVIGTWLIRLQGLSALARAQAALERQELPVGEIFEGLCLLLAGALLLTPGFVTDAAGFVLLAPPVRRLAGQYLWRALERRGGINIHLAGGRPTSGDGDAIDGEYRDVTGDDDNTPDSSVQGRLPPRKS